MRLTLIVRHINSWFARVVYERDCWDLDLENLVTLHHRLLGPLLVIALGVEQQVNVFFSAT